MGRVVAVVKRAWLVIAALALVGGCILTRAPSGTERPRWRITGPSTFTHGCATVRAFVRKSGKTGVGMSLELRSTSSCAIRIERAVLVLAGGVHVPAGYQPVPTLVGRSLIHHWLSFAFDNNAAWNQRIVHGVFELQLTVGGVPAPVWRLAAQDR